MVARPLTRSRLPAPAKVGEDEVIDLRDGGDSTLGSGDADRRDGSGEPGQLRESKFFGSPAFRRLWFSQVLSSLGDWIGLFALTAIALRVGGSNLAVFGGTSLVLAARLIPGFFLAPFAGVLVDRWNRKTIMVVCDFGRAGVLCCLPFVNDIVGLFVASLMLELFTLMWSPAKEASVPNLVKPSFLPTANSLSLAAAYGTIPIAGAVFALLIKIPEWAAGVPIIDALQLSEESLALYFDALTYLISASVIATLALSHQKRPKQTHESEDKKGGFTEAREGWRYVGTNTRVRSVIVGMATGLIGGAMIVPLGTVFANDVLGAGSAGYGLLLTGMGSGVAVGVIGVSIFQKFVPVERAFVMGLIGAGASLLAAASVTSLAFAVAFAALLGFFAGSAYVLGLTCVQVNSIDEMRGRVFATLYTLTRLCILLALTIAPLLSLLFGSITSSLFDGAVELPGMDLALPGVRITLWLGGAILMGAGLLAAYSLRRPVRQPT